MLLWTAQVPHACGPEFAPPVAGNWVYVPGVEHGVYRAMNSATGEVAWSASVGAHRQQASTIAQLGGSAFSRSFSTLLIL